MILLSLQQTRNHLIFNHKRNCSLVVFFTNKIQQNIQKYFFIDFLTFKPEYQRLSGTRHNNLSLQFAYDRRGYMDNLIFINNNRNMVIVNFQQFSTCLVHTVIGFREDYIANLQLGFDLLQTLLLNKVNGVAISRRLRRYNFNQIMHKHSPYCLHLLLFLCKTVLIQLFLHLQSNQQKGNLNFIRIVIFVIIQQYINHSKGMLPNQTRFLIMLMFSLALVFSSSDLHYKDEQIQQRGNIDKSLIYELQEYQASLQQLLKQFDQNSQVLKKERDQIKAQQLTQQTVSKQKQNIIQHKNILDENKKLKLLKLMHLIKQVQDGQFVEQLLAKYEKQNSNKNQSNFYSRQDTQVLHNIQNKKQKQKQPEYELYEECQSQITEYIIVVRLYQRQLKIKLTNLEKRVVYQGTFNENSKGIHRRVYITDIFKKLCNEQMYANRMSVSSRRPEMKYQIVVSDGVIKVPMKITVEDSVYIPVSELRLVKTMEVPAEQISIQNRQKIITKPQQKQKKQMTTHKQIKKQVNDIKPTIDNQQVSKQSQEQMERQMQRIQRQKMFIQNKFKGQQMTRYSSMEQRNGRVNKKRIQTSHKQFNELKNNKNGGWSVFDKLKSLALAFLSLAGIIYLMRPKKRIPIPPILYKLDKKLINFKQFQFKGNSIIKKLTGDWIKIVTNISIKNKRQIKLKVKRKNDWAINVGIINILKNKQNDEIPMNIMYGSNRIFYQNSTVKLGQGEGFNNQQLLVIIVQLQQNTISWNAQGQKRFSYKTPMNIIEGQWRFCLQMRGANDQIQIIQ